MKAWFRFSPIILVFTLSILACSTGTLNPRQAASGDILFEDDFSSSNSGWDRIQDADGKTDYVDGKYRIEVNTKDINILANPGKKFGDVSIQVVAAKANGADDNLYGVICRYENADNFYFFIISSDGYYGIGKSKDGKYILVNQAEMLPSEDIRRGGESNTIQAGCVGSTLTLSVNGKLLDTQQDSEFSAGDVGLLAGTYTEAGVVVEFDDFVVKKP